MPLSDMKYKYSKKVTDAILQISIKPLPEINFTGSLCT